MNLAKLTVCCLFVFISTTNLIGQTIFINEFMADNSQTIADEQGEFDDWVEIYNAGNTPYDLGGKYLTDDLNEPNQWQIPTTNPTLTTIPAGGYLLLWFDKEPEQGELHAEIKLGSGGEQIGLYDADGLTPIDTLTFGPQTSDVSQGRTTDGDTNFSFFPFPTPAAINAVIISDELKPPTFSLNGGYYSYSINLVLAATTPAVTIHYTTDGSDPTEESPIFNNFITIDTAQVIRAKAFKNGFLSSPIATNTYFFNVNHTFPIITLSGDPASFFSDESGLFPNIDQDLEIPINVEFYEPDGTQGFNQVTEVELHGSASLSLPQKSLAIKAKGSLGKSTIDWPLFPEEDRDQYRSLILRNSGQDWEYTMFRDAMQSSLTRDLSDLAVEIEQPELEGQAYRPVVAYINGQYYGIYNMRERLDKRYIRVHYDLKEDEIDFLENLDEAKEGDFLAWNSLDSLLRTKSFADEAGLVELNALVDLDNYMDYIITNLFVDNMDWPGNNNRRWRERTPNGKWRWMVKDLDFTFGWLDYNTGAFNSGSYNVNSLDRLLYPDHLYPNPEWATILFNKLLENPQWRNDFINRMADHLNVLYPTDRILQRIEDFQAIYEPEINQQNQKWSNVWTWQEDIEILNIFARGRTEAVRGHFEQSLSAITGQSRVKVSALPTNGGSVKISTITTQEANFPWPGTYFNGIEIPLEAVANPGFIFAGWSPNVANQNASSTITLNGDASITAIFIPEDEVGEPLNQVISFLPLADKHVDDLPFPIFSTASSGLPVSLSILSGPATITGNTITLTGEIGTVVVQAIQAGNQQFQAATTVNRSFKVSEDIVLSTEDYCESSGFAPWDEYIAQVRFEAIDNITSKDPYKDYTNQIATIAQGKTYPIELTPGFSWLHYEEVFSVWIDWNQDQDFDDAGEAVYTGNFSSTAHNTTPDPILGAIIVPDNALLGSTRMRITLQRDEGTLPCGEFDFGEVEDYGIKIIEADESTNGIDLTCSSTITVNALDGENGSLVQWDLPETTTNCSDGIKSIIQSIGSPSGSFFPMGSSIIEYTVEDNCGNIDNCQFEIRVIRPNEYCLSQGIQPWEEYIAHVQLNTIDHASFKNSYADFSTISTELKRGEDYEISLTPGFSFFQYDEIFQVWIDYDGNNSFDEDELVFTGVYPAQAALSTPPTLTGIFSIPSNIRPISTRMRITMQRDSGVGPCAVFDFGEVEDYGIEIVPRNTSNSRKAPYFDFTAFKRHRAVELQWLTNTHPESSSFILERSADGLFFETLENFSPPAAEESDAFFKTIDTAPIEGVNYYRIKQVFQDQRVDYTPIEIVKFEIDLEAISIFPNPAVDILYISLKELEGRKGTIQVIDTYGKLFKEFDLEKIPAAPIAIPLGEINNGLYYVKIEVVGQQPFIKKVVVSHE